MRLMAAFPSYYKGTGAGRRHDRRGSECPGSDGGGRVGGSSGSSCPVPASFSMLEMDENDNSFPWGMMHHNELATMLNNGLGKTMVIDSRSFLEYNTSTIQQSVNVCCSKLVKRRLQQDKVHVLDLLNQACNIGADASWDVVVYDQCTEDPSQLTSDNFVAVLLHKLSTTFNSVAFLKGGFLTFQASHPNLTDNKSSSQRCSTLTSLSQPCMPVSNMGPTRILPFLYLGSQQDSLNHELAQINGISYILNVSKTCPRPPFILENHFHRIPVNDNYCEKLLPFFPEAFQFLDKVREANGCVLVHCFGGVSRSATLAIAYIMRYFNMSSDEAYRYVKDKRPTISPNFNFLGQLFEYEKILRQEKQEYVRRKIFREEEICFGETGRASPGVMDLHTSSPSSPGPRVSHTPAPPDLACPQFMSHKLSSATSSTFSFLLPQPVGPVAAVGDSPVLYQNVHTVSDFLACGEPSFESCPFPGPQSELCPPAKPYDQENCGSHSKTACFSAAALNRQTVSSGNSCFDNHDMCSIQPIMTSFCDNSKQDTPHIPAQSPVCPISGFPGPASSTEDFPESTCPITGFPGPSRIGSILSMTARQAGQLTADSSDLSHCTVTTRTEVVTVNKDTNTYHNFNLNSGLVSELADDCSNSALSTVKPSGTEASGDLFSKTAVKEQNRSKAGFSLSSVFSSLRWKSRPPTLSLGSPIGGVKEVGRHSKKNKVDNIGVGDSRIQLTPVSEAVENCDLSVSEGMSESVAASNVPSPGCVANVWQLGLDVQGQDPKAGNSPRYATSATMASIHGNLLSASSPSIPAPSSVGDTSTSLQSEASHSFSIYGKPKSLNISAKRFTLPLSSPTLEFPAAISSIRSLSSPGDSNKRKSFPPSASDSPDKLAKTGDHHFQTVSPPKSLNLTQSFFGKMRPRFSRRTFVVPLSSPTSSTAEGLARLQVTSPSDIHSEAANKMDLMYTNQDHRNSHISYHTNRSDSDISDLSISQQQSKVSLGRHSVSVIRSCTLQSYTKWKSATNLNVSNLNQTLPREISALQENTAVNCPHKQADISLLSCVRPTVKSVSPLSLSSSSSLSKSCTSIYSPPASSFSEASSFSSCSLNLQGFSMFPTTSLDKLSFTPCYTKDIVQELSQQQSEPEASVEPEAVHRERASTSSVLDSPMSISSGSSAPSIASSTLSPVESSLLHVFADHSVSRRSTDFHLTESPAAVMSSQVSNFERFLNCSDSPNQLSPDSDLWLSSPSSLPQATMAPPILTSTSSFSSSGISFEPLSPMSLSGSNSYSPPPSPFRMGAISSLTSSVSTPPSSLSSPVISPPAFSPLVSSPGSSSSNLSSVLSSVSYSSTKVVRRDKNKRTIERPNSIAFSSYPTCDLVPVSTISCSDQGQGSLDDSSEAFMNEKSKRSRQSSHLESHTPHGRTSWGGYSEREIYRQITAAMENAMLRTQVFSSSSTSSGKPLPSQISSRKSKSLDDILDNGVDEGDFLSVQQGGDAWSLRSERYRCGLQNVSEPYQSSSSISSSGSHNGSMEIQVS